MAYERLQLDNSVYLRLTTFDVSNNDPRRYNRPTASEVGVLMVGSGDECNHERDIIVQAHHGPLQRISELHSGKLQWYATCAISLYSILCV